MKKLKVTNYWSFNVDSVVFCLELTLFDEKGDKTNLPDKERQVEAFQLLFLILPSANRSLLKLLLDLLYHTARNQQINKMSAINLATMFAPHIIWPKNVRYPSPVLQHSRFYYIVQA